jgi:hypothetical protein
MSGRGRIQFAAAARSARAGCRISRRLAGMVIVSRRSQGKRNPANAQNPDEISISVILPAKVRQCVYARFIAMFKLPFKFDRP